MAAVPEASKYVLDPAQSSVAMSHRGSIEGRLTIRGVTKSQPITAKVTAVEAGAVTLTTQFAVDRTVFGITWNQLGSIRGHATVTATLRFTRAGA
jgi:polyisoprenoid-binding protein YceI